MWLCEERGVVPSEAIEQATSRKTKINRGCAGHVRGRGWPKTLRNKQSAQHLNTILAPY